MEATQAYLSLHLSKYHIVENHLSRLNYINLTKLQPVLVRVLEGSDEIARGLSDISLVANAISYLYKIT